MIRVSSRIRPLVRFTRDLPRQGFCIYGVQQRLENLEDDVSVKDLADYPRYLIRNAQGDYWSNDLGWVDYTSADVFSHLEKERLDLPSEGEWVPLAESRPVIGFPGNDLKALLGEDFVNKTDAFLQEQGMLCVLEWHPQGRLVGQAQAAGQALTARLSLNSADSLLLRREDSLKLLGQLRESVRGFLPKSAESRVQVVPQRPQYDRWNDRWNLELVVLEASEDDLEAKEVYFDEDPLEFAAPQGLSPEGERARQIIVQVLRRNGDLNSRGQKHVFYTPTQWAAIDRNNIVGGALVVVHDGGDHAPYFDSSYGAHVMQSRMDLALRKEGFRVDPYGYFSVILLELDDEENEKFVQELETWLTANQDAPLAPDQEAVIQASRRYAQEGLEDEDDVNWKDLQLPLDKEATIRHMFQQAGLKITSIQEVPQTREWGDLGHAQRIIVAYAPPDAARPWTTDPDAWEAVDAFCQQIKSALYAILDTSDIEWLRGWGMEAQDERCQNAWNLYWYIGDPDITQHREVFEASEDDIDVKDYSDDIPQSRDFQNYLAKRGFRRLSSPMELGDYFKKTPTVYARVRVYQYPNYIQYLLGFKEDTHWFKVSEMTNAYRVLSVLQQRGLFDVQEGLGEAFGVDDPDLCGFDSTAAPDMATRWNNFLQAWRDRGWTVIQGSGYYAQRTAWLDAIMPSHMRKEDARHEVQKMVYEYLGGGRLVDFTYHNGHVYFDIYDLCGVAEAEEEDDFDWKEVMPDRPLTIKEVRIELEARGVKDVFAYNDHGRLRFEGYLEGVTAQQAFALGNAAMAALGVDEKDASLAYHEEYETLYLTFGQEQLHENSAEGDDADWKELSAHPKPSFREVREAMKRRGIIYNRFVRTKSYVTFLGWFKPMQQELDVLPLLREITAEMGLEHSDSHYAYLPSTGQVEITLAQTDLLESQEEEDADWKDLTSPTASCQEIMNVMTEVGVWDIHVVRPEQPEGYDFVVFMGHWLPGQPDREAYQMGARIWKGLNFPKTREDQFDVNYMPTSGELDFVLPTMYVSDWQAHLAESCPGLITRIMAADGVVRNVQDEVAEGLVTVQGEWRPESTLQALAEAISVDRNKIRYDHKTGEFSVLATQQAFVQEASADEDDFGLTDPKNLEHFNEPDIDLERLGYSPGETPDYVGDEELGLTPEERQAMTYDEYSRRYGGLNNFKHAHGGGWATRDFARPYWMRQFSVSGYHIMVTFLQGYMSNAKFLPGEGRFAGDPAHYVDLEIDIGKAKAEADSRYMRLGPFHVPHQKMALVADQLNQFFAELAEGGQSFDARQLRELVNQKVISILRVGGPQAPVREDQADGKTSDTKRVAIVAVFRQKQDDPAYECLVCKREGPPAEGEWVIPGGHAEEGEKIETAARRELKEEAHVDLGDLTFVKTMPNETGELEVHVFGAILPEGERAKAGDDAEKVKWLPLDDLPRLGLDNDSLIREVADKMELQRLSSVDEALSPRLANQIRSVATALKPRRVDIAGMSFELQEPEGLIDRLIEGIEGELAQLQADRQPELRLMDLIEDAYSQLGVYLRPDDQQDVERLAKALAPLFTKSARRRVKESVEAPLRYGTVTDEVLPALEQALVEVFGTRYDWLVPHVIQHMDPEISLVAMEGDRVIGFYILGRRSVLEGIRREHLKPTEDLNPYRRRRGIEGVALGTVPDRRGTGLGSRFKDYPQTLGADYIWGLQMHDLDNLSHWLKRRRVVARNPEMVATLQDFKPGAVAEASEEDFEAKDLEDDLLSEERFKQFAHEHDLLYHPGAKMVRDAQDNVYGSVWFRTSRYLNQEATVRQWTQVFSDYFKIDPARMKVAYYPPSGDIMVMVTNLVL